MKNTKVETLLDDRCCETSNHHLQQGKISKLEVFVRRSRLGDEKKERDHERKEPSPVKSLAIATQRFDSRR